jgi:hypothetical protein
MTIAVVWYREKFDELWAVADTRISRERNGSVEIVTDGGPKLFVVPLTCRYGKHPNIKRSHRLSFGFAYAGNSIAALSTHAFVTARADNLYNAEKMGVPKLADLAELFRKVGEHYVREMCSRVSFDADHKLNAFQGLVFGFCPTTHAYDLHQIEPRFSASGVAFEVYKMELRPKVYFPIGSGTASFAALSNELQHKYSGSPENTGVMLTMKEYLKNPQRPDVGGSYQVGVADKKGFRLRPVLEPIKGEDLAADFVHLGFDLTRLGKVGNYQIGDMAVGPDIHELKSIKNRP